MNKQQKEYQQAILENEKEVLEALKQNYEEALLEINSNLHYLMNREDADMQHVIYQAEYQRALKDQVEGILNQLNKDEFETVSEYLEKCYEEGFVGTMYDLQSQGIPLIFPIDQEKVVQAIQHDTKLSTSLYSAFDMKELKRNIAGEISRGISSAVTYNEIARNISGYCNVNLNNAMRIARTEGHRINIKASMDAQQKAKEKGADVVKQWDASLDGKTREHHRELDGQIRELDEDFEYSGGSVSAPSHFGIPSEDINCRCCLLQRARWALGEDITKYSPDAVEEISDDGATKLFKIKADDYESFKNEYFKELDRVRSDEQKTNPLEKDGKSSTIKAQNDQKKAFTKVNVEEIPSMDSEKFTKMKEGLERNGIKVIQDKDGDEYLKAMGAEAMTLSDGSAVIFQSNRIPSASAVFEEVIHTTQIREKGMIQTSGDKSGTVEYLKREIEANEKLLNYKDSYGLTQKDVESVQENLEMYYEMLKEVE